MKRTDANKLLDRLPLWFIPTGAYARGNTLLGDLDLIVLDRTIRHALDTLAAVYPLRVIKEGALYASVHIARLGYVDLWRTTKKELPFMVMHRTGPRSFNIRTRAHAKRLGYLLNEHGLYRGTRRVPGLTTERAIFHFLGLTWRDPPARV